MPPTRSPKPATALGTAALALLVVGAGAAIGMGTTGSSPHQPTVGVSAPTTTAGSASGASSRPAAAHPATGSTTTTTAKGGSSAVPVVGSSSSVAGRSGSGAGGTTPTSAATVVGRDSTTTIARRAASTPADTTPAGTYTYATTGSSKLFGKTYSYPPSTTIDVTPQGCGVAGKWNSSPGNSTTTVECPVTGGVHVVSETSQVSDGPYNQTMTFTCAPNSFVPTSGTPGRTWNWTCSSSGSNGTETTTQVVTLVGPRTTTVGGTTVDVEQVTVDSTLSGPEQGTVKTTYWLTSNATPVYEAGSINASQYGVSYSSNYTLRLDSLTPTH